MRRHLLIALGTLMFVCGVCVGLLLYRFGAFGQSSAPAEPGAVSVTVTGEGEMKRQTKQTHSALADDQQALQGLWIQPRGPQADPKILSFRDGHVKVCHLDRAAMSSYATFLISFVLVEEGGKRLLLDAEQLESADARVPLFSYRLIGDTLELERIVPADYGDMHDYDLGGKWFRLHYPQDAGPGR